MAELKTGGEFGLIFLDAHADFYKPEESPTGEVADMDLAIITGRGPEILANINNLKPYVQSKNVIHLGQRDWEETRRYGSKDIGKTAIKCFGYEDIKRKGMEIVIAEVLQHIEKLKVEGFWVHFDTDVLSDEINPAVDYRLPGGLSLEQVESFIQSLLRTEKILGVSVAIFNPKLDIDGRIASKLVKSLGRAFDVETHNNRG